MNSCIQFLDILERWNRTHALTSLLPNQRLEELIQDSCAFLPHLEMFHKCSPILDFGTGMGIPSVVLALARPDLEFIALDKSKKKISFVRQVVMELNLKNLSPVIGRTEEMPSFGAHAGVAKAVGSIEMLCSWWKIHRNLPSSPLILAKGPEWRKEALPEGWQLKIDPYELPNKSARYMLYLSQ